MKKAIVSFALVLVLSMSSFAGNKEKNERREKVNSLVNKW